MDRVTLYKNLGKYKHQISSVSHLKELKQIVHKIHVKLKAHAINFGAEHDYNRPLYSPLW